MFLNAVVSFHNIQWSIKTKAYLTVVVLQIMLRCFIPKLISLHTTSALKLHYVFQIIRGGVVKYLGGNIQNYGKLSPQMYSHSFRGVIVACFVE